jgi:uncharacterized membrane protein YjgN (DUF898 family)
MTGGQIMRYFISSCGFYIFPIMLVAAIIIVLAVVNGLRLLRWRQRPDERTGTSIDAILFWGIVCAVLGFLGQWTGLYKVTTFLRDAPMFNPAALADGIAESLQTSIIGLGILLLAALLWLGLRSLRNRLVAGESQPASGLAAEEV